MDYAHLHEIEVVKFRSPSPRPVAELLAVFASQGFTLHEDVVSLDRTGKFPPWQHPSVVEVEVLHEGEEVFGFEEGLWDTIELKYLVASLPFENTNRFLDVVATTSRSLGIPPEFKGEETTLDTIRSEFTRIRDELRAETGEDAGSERLAILIQSTYPRR
jgi:hypothetical protein